MNMKISFLLLFLVFLSLSFNTCYAKNDPTRDICLKRFLSKPEILKNCEIACPPNVFDLFEMCQTYCEDFCEQYASNADISSLLTFYGLSESETKLVVQNPVRMLKAYNLSWDAEKLCLTLYPKSSTNDESDACRHFVWSGLLFKEFGLEYSKAVLDAHEQTIGQPENEKVMDTFNNNQGVETAKKLQNMNQLKADKLLIETHSFDKDQLQIQLNLEI